MSKLPSFLDFEASSLSSESYPIEVAWSLADGSIECYLISPAGIEEWTDWSLLSEKVHGIARDELLSAGKSPEWICARMNAQLSGQTIYTDNPDYDGRWLAKLFAVTKGIKPMFRIGLVDKLLVGHVYSNPANWAVEMHRIRKAKEEARRCVGGQHRADLDVQYLRELYRIVTEEQG